jgi:hypothetical protein
MSGEDSRSSRAMFLPIPIVVVSVSAPAITTASHTEKGKVRVIFGYALPPSRSLIPIWCFVAWHKTDGIFGGFVSWFGGGCRGRLRWRFYIHVGLEGRGSSEESIRHIMKPAVHYVCE